MGEPGDAVGAGRGDQDQIAPAGQFDMPHAGLGIMVQQFGMHRPARQGLHGQGGDKFTGGAGHHHPYVGAPFAQAAHQIRAFVGGDTAGDTEQDALVD